MSLEKLYARVLASRDGDPATSYTASLVKRGRPRIAQKLGEEAIEAALALALGDKAALVGESADLLYHLIVAWSEAGITPDEIWAELERREAQGGLAEKRSRPKS